MIHSRKWLLILLLPGLAGFILFWIYPVLSGVYFSMTDYLGGKRFIFLDNYIGLIKNKVFLSSLKNTLYLTSFSLILIILLSFLIAYYIWKHYQARRLLKVVVLPMAVAAIAVSYVWDSLFALDSGINQVITDILGWQLFNWHKGILSYVPIVLFYVWKYMGMNVIIFVSALATIPTEMIQAFLMDSKSNLKQIYYIICPYIIPQMIFAFFISLMYGLWLSQDIAILSKDYPPAQLYLLQHFISNSFRKLSYENAAAASTILIVIIGAILAVLRKLERRYEIQ